MKETTKQNLINTSALVAAIVGTLGVTFAVPLVGHLLTAWDRYLDRVFK